jgi:hypothetical protein
MTQATQLRPRDWTVQRAHLADFVREHLPYPRVFATLSGADLYGFPSDDGDFDIRASHVLPINALLVAMLNEGGMDRTPDITLEKTIKRPQPVMDFVSHDIGKFLRLALKGNGYVLEQLLSPLVVETSEWHAELKNIAPGLITRRLYYHYRGFFANQEKIYHNIGSKKVKGLLYQYRVALTGIHVLETGEIEANAVRLNEHFRLSGIDELIAMKVGGEDTFLTDDAPYVAEIETLEPKLNAAFERSRLPLEPSAEAQNAAKDFLIRCRRTLGNS